MSSVAGLFAALGDETRLAILARLCEGGPKSITALAENSSVTRQAVTKHLSILAQAGLVHDSAKGRERIWTAETRRIEDARQYLDQISRQWDDALLRLKAYAESNPVPSG